MIIKRPGQKSGIVNPQMASFLDILPTAIAWSGHKDSDIKTPNTDKSPPRLGDSLLPILEEEKLLSKEHWKQHVLGSHTFHEIQNYWPTRYLRTHKYKYHRNIAHRLDFPFAADLYCSLTWEGIRNKDGPVTIGKRPLEQYLFRGPEELYDLENDPNEIHNLVDNRGKAVAKKYEGLLQEARETVEAWQYLTKDTWLYKDGMSAVVMEPYIRQGLKLPDRFEIDLKNPGTKKVKGWEPPVVKDVKALPRENSELVAPKEADAGTSVLGALCGWLWRK
jgi:N-sulfoglucosamine sulfohydrolase